MSKCQQLEQLRNELKKKMNDIIDEAIDKLQDIMGDVSSSDGDNKLYAKNEKRVDTTLNYSQNETSETSDNDSVTLDYTCVDNVLSPDSETASSTQDSIISNSVPLKESNVSSQLSQRESDKKPFVSPILERCARQSMKRTQSDQSINSVSSSDAIFSKSLSCITPVKDRKKLAPEKPIIRNKTPPHFWSLDMPPSPVL